MATEWPLQKAPVIDWPLTCTRLAGGEMVDDNAAASSIENDDSLENRLKEANAEDSRQLLEEFLQAFYLDNSEVSPVD
jgi:hypothetical protein